MVLIVVVVDRSLPIIIGLIISGTILRRKDSSNLFLFHQHVLSSDATPIRRGVLRAHPHVCKAGLVPL